MHDPDEGVTPSGLIRTGVGQRRISGAFEPVLDVSVAAVQEVNPESSVYVYGSVATGMAQSPESDVDLLAVGITNADASRVGRTLSRRFPTVCRAIELAAAANNDFLGETDSAYGGRVFLRHYCLHLAGPDIRSTLPDYPADVRAARGFNGDIALYVARWRDQLNSGKDPTVIGRRLARKSLLALAGLVSVYDSTWTTDRARAARRWAEIQPSLADDLHTLLSWADDGAPPDQVAVAAALNGVVTQIVGAFVASIGLWDAH